MAEAITWTRLIVILPGDYADFMLWKAEAAGVTVCAASPEAARARLAEALEAHEAA